MYRDQRHNSTRLAGYREQAASILGKLRRFTPATVVCRFSISARSAPRGLPALSISRYK